MLRAYTPADRDWVAAAHSAHYRNVEQFDASFDAAVMAALADLSDRIGRDQSFGLILQTAAGDRCGSIFVCDMGGAVARLRLFLLARAYHCRGNGQRMLEATLAAAGGAGFHRVEVSTFDAHAKACALYARMGFVEAGRTACKAFGRSMVRIDFSIGIGRA